MNILILGAGQVGTTLAQHLAQEDSNLTIVDSESAHLERLQEQLDIRVVHGNACHPNVLRKAGGDDADMIIAVTNQDESNLVACQVAHTLFQTPTKIARIRSLSFLAHEELFGTNAFPVDVIISPEQLVARHIYDLIIHPEAKQVLDFANKKVQLVHLKLSFHAQMSRKPIQALRDVVPATDCRIAAIFRKNTYIIPDGNTVFKPNDEIFFLAARERVSDVISAFKDLSDPVRTILIAGGGHIGGRLAESLDHRYKVKVIDHNPKQVKHLAMHLQNGLVLFGDATDKELLQNENVRQTDVFCAVTNNDEVNILSAMLAKKIGAKKVMALVNRSSYVDLLEYSKVDITIAPQETTIGSLLSHIRGGNVVKVHTLKHGTAEVLEGIAHGPKEHSQIIGQKISDIQLPKQACIVGLVRREEIKMAHHDIVIEENDHVIVFLANKRCIADIERLFTSEIPVF